MIPNDRILQIIDRKTSLLDAFGAVDDILKQGVQGIADLITINGIVNLDFADVKSIMHDAGSALMGIGQGTGDTRAVDAVKQAIDSPLLEVSITGAKGVLINFTGGRDMGMHEVEEAAKLIHDSVDPEANIIFGTVIDENMTGEIRVTLVATGFDSERRSSSDYGIFSPTTTLEEAQSGVEHEDLPQDKFTPFLSNEQPKALFEDPAEPMVRAQPEDINRSIEPDEEIIGFDLDEDVLEEESKKVPFDKTEPIVETVTSSRSYDDDEIDKPAFLREGKKISQSDSADDSDDDESMPSFIKRKL
jgi:hypothetical protein